MITDRIGLHSVLLPLLIVIMLLKNIEKERVEFRLEVFLGELSIVSFISEELRTTTGLHLTVSLWDTAEIRFLTSQ